MSTVTTSLDPTEFRRILGEYPTGVCVVTAMAADGPVGMAVGSFTSVSLDPPLVAFLPDKSSTSWPRIRATGRFCVNVLGEDQAHVCRTFATSGIEKFANIEWRRSGTGLPVLTGATAWVDCDLEAVHEAGDHFIVVGRVRELDVAAANLPLLFFRGGYGRPLVGTPDAAAVAAEFRRADAHRREVERLASETRLECLASTAIANEMVAIACAGQSQSDRTIRPGDRFELVPPFGIAHAAWFNGAGSASFGPAVARTRELGYAVTIAVKGHRRLHDLLSQPASPPPSVSAIEPNPEPTMPPDVEQMHPDELCAVAAIEAPVMDRAGRPFSVLTLSGFGGSLARAELEELVAILRAGCDRIDRT